MFVVPLLIISQSKEQIIWLLCRKAGMRIGNRKEPSSGSTLSALPSISNATEVVKAFNQTKAPIAGIIQGAMVLRVIRICGSNT